jgi:glycogen operon protein
MSLAELHRMQPGQWHGVKLHQPDWGHASHSLAVTVRLIGYPVSTHLMVNAYWEPLEFEVPPLDDPREQWRRCIDTYRDAPDDIRDWSEAPALQGRTCRVEPRSLVLLFATATSTQPPA